MFRIPNRKQFSPAPHAARASADLLTIEGVPDLLEIVAHKQRGAAVRAKSLQLVRIEVFAAAAAFEMCKVRHADSYPAVSGDAQPR